MIKAAIFDLDGTLLDSMGAWTQLDVNFLLRHGKIARPDVHDAVKTLTLRQSAQYFQKEYGVEATEDEIIDEIKDMIRRAYAEEIGPMPGAIEALELINSLGLPMAVATATDYEMALSALKRLDMLRYFKTVLTCDMVGKSKTEPDVFFEAARQLGAAPDDCLVFEDSAFAAATAHNAGFKLAFVCCEDTPPAFADVVLHDYAELSDYLK